MATSVKFEGAILKDLLNSLSKTGCIITKVSDDLGIDTSTIYKMIKSGKAPLPTVNTIITYTKAMMR